MATKSLRSMLSTRIDKLDKIVDEKLVTQKRGTKMELKRKSLWEYAVLCHPTKREAEDGKETEIVLKPDFMVASSENEVVLKVSKQIPDEWMEKADRLEVAVRPF